MRSADAALDNKLWTPIQMPWGIIACGGIAAALGADLMDLKGFPINVIGKDGWIIDTIPEPIDTRLPGYQPADVPGANEPLNMTEQEKLTPAESAANYELLKQKGYLDGLPTGDTQRLVLTGDSYAQLKNAVEQMNLLKSQGLTTDEALQVIMKQRPELRAPLHIIFHQNAMGDNVVVTDRNATSAIRFHNNDYIDIKYGN